MHRKQTALSGFLAKSVRAICLALLAASLAGCSVQQGASTDTGAQEATEPNTAASSAAQAVDLDAWTAGSASLKALTDYVAAATAEGTDSYIPPEERIAVFDLDGTLMCETYPWCFEYMVFADYALNNPNYQAPKEVASVAREIIDSAWGEKPDGMSTRQAAAAAVAYAGLTPQELEEYVTAFKDSPAEGFSGMTRGDAWYKPMIQVVGYLQQNDFDVYVVTATERNIVRALVAGTLDVDPSHVIGTEYGYTATGQNGTADADYTFQPGDKMVFDGTYAGENAKTCKVDAIVREIGRRPVLAFGNSSGDASMLSYTLANDEHSAMAFMVVADDAEREYGDVEGAAEERAEWEEKGFAVFSMKDDFATIYGDGVQKAPVARAAE